MCMTRNERKSQFFPFFSYEVKGSARDSMHGCAKIFFLSEMDTCIPLGDAYIFKSEAFEVAESIEAFFYL